MAKLGLPPIGSVFFSPAQSDGAAETTRFARSVSTASATEPTVRDRQPSDVMLHTDRLPLDRLITAVEPLERLPALFEEHADGSAAMKVLVDCRA